MLYKTVVHLTSATPTFANCSSHLRGRILHENCKSNFPDYNYVLGIPLLLEIHAFEFDLTSPRLNVFQTKRVFRSMLRRSLELILGYRVHVRPTGDALIWVYTSTMWNY